MISILPNPLGRVLGGRTDSVTECRQCGTNVDPGTEECPECGSTDILTYHFDT